MGFKFCFFLIPREEERQCSWQLWSLQGSPQKIRPSPLPRHLPHGTEDWLGSKSFWCSHSPSLSSEALHDGGPVCTLRLLVSSLLLGGGDVCAALPRCCHGILGAVLLSVPSLCVSLSPLATGACPEGLDHAWSCWAVGAAPRVALQASSPAQHCSCFVLAVQ